MQEGLFETEEFEDFESEDDSRTVGSQIFQNVVIQDSDWTTETLLSQIAKNNIDLSPRFQRRDAWTPERKSKFIESLILGIPIPQIVLAQSREHRGRLIVIDGKQRLLALSAFAGSAVEAPLKLSGLTVRRDLNGLTWYDIKDGKGQFDDADAFENTTIRTTIIKGYSTDEVLYTIYHRLNSGSVPLSPQELRHVLKPGEFMDFAFDFSEESKALISLFGRNNKPDFRMRDIEMLIRYFALTENLGRYNGDLKSFLDETVDLLNSKWVGDQQRIQNSAVECEEAIRATIDVFGVNAFKKPKNGSFESRFNRAIFDVMVYYFSEPAVRSVVCQKKADVVSAFIDLCQSADFMRSIESTTKTTTALKTRLLGWGNALAACLGLSSERLKNAQSAFLEN